MGMAKETIVYIDIIIPVTISLKLDTMVGFAFLTRGKVIHIHSISHRIIFLVISQMIRSGPFQDITGVYYVTNKTCRFRYNSMDY